MRTPIRKRELPDYTKREELLNVFTHIAGAVLAAAVLVLSLLKSTAKGNAWGVVSTAIYGASMMMVFTISAVYHGLRPGTAKKVLQVIDHCDIYFLIAGTYTPIVLVAVRPVSPILSWVVFGVEWGMAALGITLNAIDLKKYRHFSMICYLVMGWCVLTCLRPTIGAMTWTGFLLLLSGGVAYTLGALLYQIGKKKRYFHSLFHVFVVLGAALQAGSIYWFVL